MCQRPIFAKTQSLVANSSRETQQRISTGLSLISLAVRFWVFGMLIFINRHQVELNGLSGGSSVAIVGGISALLVGVFLVAAYLHWRFCARHPAALPVLRLTTPAYLTVPSFRLPCGIKPRLVLYLTKEEGKSIIERPIVVLRSCQASDHRSPKAFRIAQVR
jgi:hypothetical protein